MVTVYVQSCNIFQPCDFRSWHHILKTFFFWRKRRKCTPSLVSKFYSKFKCVNKRQYPRFVSDIYLHETGFRILWRKLQKLSMLFWEPFCELFAHCIAASSTMHSRQGWYDRVTEYMLPFVNICTERYPHFVWHTNDNHSIPRGRSNVMCCGYGREY